MDIEEQGCPEEQPKHPMVSSQELVAQAATPSANLVRGVPLGEVMRHMGSVLAQSTGQAADYEKSSPCRELDLFLSHNWSTPRMPKFLSLAVHFHLALATAAMWVAGALASVLTAAGVLPVVPIAFAFHGTGTYCFNSVILGHVVFFIFLCFGSEIRSLVGAPTPSTFLDKLCIHQTDEKLKKEGIRSLAAFLRVSKQMFVVYTDIYLRKLWTVYEVASFLTLRGDSRCMVIMPAAQGRRLVMMMVLTVCIVNGCRAPGFVKTLPHWDFVDIMWPSATAVALCLYVITARAWKREVYKMECHMRNFSLKHAMCFVESDRALVHENICAFMKYFHLVPDSTSESAALDEFDKLVHTELPPAIEASFGRNVLGYNFIIAITAGVLLEAFDVAGARWRAGAPWQLIVAALIEGGTTNLLIIPISYSIMASALGTQMHLQGWKEVCHVLKWSILISPLCILYLPVHYAHMSIGRWTDRVDMWIALACMVVYPLVLTPITYWLFRPTARAAPLTQPEDKSDKEKFVDAVAYGKTDSFRAIMSF